MATTRLPSISQAEVELVERARHFPIRTMDAEMAETLLTVEITKIAQQYGARFDIADYVLEEAVLLVLNSYKKLGIEEIRQAYRAWAAGKFKVKGAEMWGGEFNVAQLGKVLTAYCEHRQGIYAEILNCEISLKRQMTEQQVRIQKSQQFKTDFPGLLKAAKKYESWQKVPLFWYDKCRELELFHITSEEASAIFDEAKQIAAAEVAQDSVNQRTNVRKILEAGIDERAKTIARKITIWRKVINKNN